MSYTRHHALMFEGAPHGADGNRLGSDGVGGAGHALCRCGEMSPTILPNWRARYAWHREHRAEVEGSCRLCDALSKMSDERRASVNRALASTIGAEPLAQILRRYGYDVGRWSITKHRNEAHPA